MTIDEAIAHAKEVAESNRRKVENDCVTGRTHLHPFCDCIKCAEEHEQLAEWLEELKRYRDTESAYEQGGKDAVKEFVKLLRNEFEAKLSFEYNLNLNDINKVINDVHKRIVR